MILEAVVWCALFAVGMLYSERLVRRARRRRRALRGNGAALLYVRGLVIQETVRFVGVTAFFLAGLLPVLDLDPHALELGLLYLGGACLVTNTLVANYFDRAIDRKLSVETSAPDDDE